MAFVKVAEAAKTPPGSTTVVEVRGRELALFNVEGTYYCLDNECPHLGGPLGEGDLEGDSVMCPWHGWQFSVRTGESLYGYGLCVASFPCKVEEGDVLVEA